MVTIPFVDVYYILDAFQILSAGHDSIEKIEMYNAKAGLCFSFVYDCAVVKYS